MVKVLSLISKVDKEREKEAYLMGMVNEELTKKRFQVSPMKTRKNLSFDGYAGRAKRHGVEYNLDLRVREFCFRDGRLSLVEFEFLSSPFHHRIHSPLPF